MRFFRHVYGGALAASVVILLAGEALGHAQQSKAVKSSESAQAASPAFRVWISQTTGREYRVHVENDRFYAEWANIPAITARQGSYIRTECQRLGEKWIGTSRIYLPCTVGFGPSRRANKCHMTMRFEITSMTVNRIAGRVENPKRFDCDRCQVVETEWRDFVWVPKR